MAIQKRYIATIQVHKEIFLKLLILFFKTYYSNQTAILNTKVQKYEMCSLLFWFKKIVVNEIVNAPFYSILFDNTQDISRSDELCELYRYCIIEKDENGTPNVFKININELFLGFHEVKALAISNR